MSIHTSYLANFIQIADVVQQVQPFKLDYSRITNKVLNSFSSTVQMFQ